jgi:hypothetical protein
LNRITIWIRCGIDADFLAKGTGLSCFEYESIGEWDSIDRIQIDDDFTGTRTVQRNNGEINDECRSDLTSCW